MIINTSVFDRLPLPEYIVWCGELSSEFTGCCDYVLTGHHYILETP